MKEKALKRKDVSNEEVKAESNPNLSKKFILDGDNKLYSEIEDYIIRWSIDGTKTAGHLTRKIMELIKVSSKEEKELVVESRLNLAACMLSILDSLKLYDTEALELGDETLSEVMFRKMRGYSIDLNKELDFDHLKPITKKKS